MAQCLSNSGNVCSTHGDHSLKLNDLSERGPARVGVHETLQVSITRQIVGTEVMVYLGNHGNGEGMHGEGKG